MVIEDLSNAKVLEKKGQEDFLLSPLSGPFFVENSLDVQPSGVYNIYLTK